MQNPFVIKGSGNHFPFPLLNCWIGLNVEDPFLLMKLKCWIGLWNDSFGVGLMVPFMWWMLLVVLFICFFSINHEYFNYWISTHWIKKFELYITLDNTKELFQTKKILQVNHKCLNNVMTFYFTILFSFYIYEKTTDFSNPKWK